MDFAAARKHMVDSQVRVNDVTDRGIQAAMLDIPRERFCAADRAFTVYGEVEPLIAGTRRLMLAREVAKLVQALDVQEGESALAIGAPYAAAVLARLGASVTAQEADPAALEVVAPALDAEGVAAVQAPFDRKHQVAKALRLLLNPGQGGRHFVLEADEALPDHQRPDEERTEGNRNRDVWIHRPMMPCPVPRRHLLRYLPTVTR